MKTRSEVIGELEKVVNQFEKYFGDRGDFEMEVIDLEESAHLRLTHYGCDRVETSKSFYYASESPKKQHREVYEKPLQVFDKNRDDYDLNY